MEDVSERLKEIYGDRRWIIAVGAAVIASRLHTQLAEWGCDTLVVAAVDGVGDIPDTEIVHTGAHGPTVIEGIRAFMRSVEEPTDEVLAAIDRFDPDRTTRVIAEPYATSTEMVRRPTFGVRKPQWSSWEDKMRVDALWDTLGIDHAPYRITDVADATAAASDLATELGTVWAADNSQGWHGGGDLVRWVQDSDQFEDSVNWFATHADQVRVMPFLDGLPCSIHGWATSSGVAVFFPVEILILRDFFGSNFGYAGVATAWTPPAAVTSEMRSVARRVGEYLRDTDGYRGPYGIDGILTESGFRPTELNPRMSAGAGIQTRDLPLPLSLAMRAEAEGAMDLDHSQLEELVTQSRGPAVHFFKPINRTDLTNSEMFIAGGMGGEPIRESPTEDASVGRLSLGPATNGSFLLGTINAEQLPNGEPAGPFVAAAVNYVNAEWDLGLPTYDAAPLPTGG